MDAHDKGIALPEEADDAPYRASTVQERRGRPKRERKPDSSYQRRGPLAIAILRRGDCRNFDDGMTVAQVAKQMGEPHSVIEKTLTQLCARGEAATAVEQGEKRWWIPKGKFKEHTARLMKQSEVAAHFFHDWTTASILSRRAMGIHIKASYPYVPAPVESSSLTTTPRT